MSQADALLTRLMNGEISGYSSGAEDLMLIDPFSRKKYKLHVANKKLTMTEMGDVTNNADAKDIRSCFIILDPVTKNYYKLEVVDGDLTMSVTEKPGFSEPHITIDDDRYINVPEELRRIAVQYDHDIETVTFDCPRYWDGHDLSTMRVYVNYRRPDGVPGSFLCESVTIDVSNPNIMHFNWTISKNATMVQGVLSFLVCIMQVDNKGNEVRHWNSELCEDMMVSTGLEVNDAIVNTYPDIITQLLLRMDSVENIQSVVQGTDLVQLNKRIDDLNIALISSTLDLEMEDAKLRTMLNNLEMELTGAKTDIARSLSAKGVSVPSNMSIQDVAALIDGITMDIPTALRAVVITKLPNKTEYSPGDAVDTKGMVVTADFGDGVTVPVERYIVSPAIVSKNTTEVEVSLTINGVTKTAKYPINVTLITAETLPAGALVSIAESNSTSAWYRVVDTNYLGNILLVRENCLGETVKYRLSAANDASDTKYEGSNLDSYLNTTFYGNLPTNVASVIQPVNIPVRASAHSDAAQAYLNRRVFALSATELGKSSISMEGEPIEYTDRVAVGVQYWTRQPSGGMTNMAYQIKADGECNSGYCTDAKCVRPAFCISKRQSMTEITGGWGIAGATT
jgi:hypothetical protein